MPHLEEWRDVVGYEGRYEVSDVGKVRSVGRHISSRNVHSDYKAWRKGKELSLQVDKFGYMTVCLYNGTKGVLKKAHRLVAEAFLGSVENLCVHHKDNNKKNNNRINLEIVEAHVNSAYAKEDGRYITGGEHYASNLDKWDCLFLDLFSKQYELKKVAKIFGTSISTVSLFRNNKHWSQQENV